MSKISVFDFTVHHLVNVHSELDIFGLCMMPQPITHESEEGPIPHWTIPHWTDWRPFLVVIIIKHIAIIKGEVFKTRKRSPDGTKWFLNKHGSVASTVGRKERMWSRMESSELDKLSSCFTWEPIVTRSNRNVWKLNPSWDHLNSEELKRSDMKVDAAANSLCRKVSFVKQPSNFFFTELNLGCNSTLSISQFCQEAHQLFSQVRQCKLSMKAWKRTNTTVHTSLPMKRILGRPLRVQPWMRMIAHRLQSCSIWTRP